MKTYCKFPFTTVAIKDFKEGELQTFWPCCNMGNLYPTDFNISDSNLMTPEEMFNHPRMEELRINIKHGIRDPACTICWRQEDAGIKSHRQFSIKTEKDVTYNAALTEIDLTTSNVCNLRCRMCTPANSNLLMADQQYFERNGLNEKANIALGWRWDKSIPLSTERSIQWQWLLDNPDKITTLKMSGGEPFYEEKVIELLRQYVSTGNSKNITLQFHTNATQFTDNILDVLSNFKLNNHTFSVDGTGAIYEYIRYPGKFSDLNSNMNNYFSKVNNRSEYQLFNLVVSSLNILNIVDFLDWSLSINKHNSYTFSEISPNTRGTVLNNLPKELLVLAKNRLETYFLEKKIKLFSGAINLIKSIENAIENNTENKQLMLDEITIFDLSRNQSYVDFLDPELVKWLANDKI